jgi:hypothetical protein
MIFVILLLVGNLIGGDSLGISCSAVGTAMIGVSGPFIAIVRSLHTA